MNQKKGIPPLQRRLLHLKGKEGKSTPSLNPSLTNVIAELKSESQYKFSKLALSQMAFLETALVRFQASRK